MVEVRTCEECGAALPANAPEGLCLQCLAQMGLLLVGNAPGRPLHTSVTAHQPVLPGRHVRYFGDYELLEEIARGGMGVVYRARQVSLNRIVAVKMLLFGEFSSDDYIKRFRAEAELAASLHHPNIVAIHEIGRHEGLHYFSMDYVPSHNLGELVRNGPLPARRAAAYLKTIVEAVDYAHRHGVLHRDLKPSNILIDEEDQPRITDFGLAKQLKSDADQTATGQVLGSPSFMPPEQADRSRAPLGPYSDIYSLGAVLYHMLTGRPPFVAEALEDTLLQLLKNDAVSPRLLNASVPRDLETICLKCLNKEPAGRYPSAAEVAKELERWLNGQPIRARAATVAEKVWRWSRREPALASLALTVILLLLTVAFGSSLMLGKERRARLNEANLRLQAQAAEKKALSAAGKSQQVSSLLEHILQGMGPSAPIAAQEKILGWAAERVREDFASQPEMQLELTLALATVCHDTGLFAKMEEMSREALRLSRVCFRDPHPTIARASALLGNALMHLQKLEDAEAFSRQALEMQRALVGENHPDLVDSINTLGVVLQREGKLDEAESLARQALDIRSQLLGRNNPELAGLLENLAHVIRDRLKFTEAEALFREALGMRLKLLGEEHQDVATSLHNLARVLYDEGRYAEAEDYFAEALARRRKSLGNEHAAVATSLHGLGLVYAATGKCAEAEQLFRESLAIRRKIYGEDHRAVAESRSSLVSVLRDQNKLGEVEAVSIEPQQR